MKIALIAGEQSGDLLGAELIEQLLAIDPTLSLFGVGGERMRKYPFESCFPIEKLQTMGFLEAITALPRLSRVFFQLRDKIIHEKPDICILIDFPEFNMRLASSLRKKGFQGKLVHYVCPSIWAWRKGRIKTLEKNYDLILSILPFEPSYFEKSRLSCCYVGHPLAHTITPSSQSRDPHLIALFPGSRSSVISNNLPVQLKAAEIFLRSHPAFSFSLSVARENLTPLIHSIVKNFSLPIHLIQGEENHSLMGRARGAIATSGTVNLELALHHTPTVVTYEITPFNYFVGRYLFRILLPYYSLPNIIAQEEVFPEIIGRKISPHSIATSLEKVLKEGNNTKEKCERIHKILGSKNTSLEAAHLILSKNPHDLISN